MVSRHYLRIKTMQALYAYNLNPDAKRSEYEIALVKAVHDCHELCVWLLALLPEIAFYRMKKLESLKEKYNPTEEDLNPNTKFVNNLIISRLENSPELKSLCSAYRVSWEDDTDLTARLFREIENLPEYEVYMSSRENNFSTDKKFILAVVEKVFASNDLLHWHLGEKNTHWIDDYEEAVMMMYKNLKDIKADDEAFVVDTLYKDPEDEAFYKQLFRKTLEHTTEYEQMIEDKLQNWEKERVMNMDMLLMEMALCELLEFPSIPIKVTLNEYIEIAKWYSSDKSKVFINGILDRLIVDLRNKEKIVKTGRGLYQN